MSRESRSAITTMTTKRRIRTETRLDVLVADCLLASEAIHSIPAFVASSTAP